MNNIKIPSAEVLERIQEDAKNESGWNGYCEKCWQNIMSGYIEDICEECNKKNNIYWDIIVKEYLTEIGRNE